MERTFRRIERQLFGTLFARSIIVAAAFSFAAVPATAQVRDVDPNEAIDADLLPPDQQTQVPSDSAPAAPARDDFPADSVAEPASPSAAIAGSARTPRCSSPCWATG